MTVREGSALNALSPAGLAGLRGRGEWEAGSGASFRAQSVRCSATKQMAIAVLGHPASTRQMGFQGAARPIRLAVRIKVQHDPRDLFPVSAVHGSVEQTEISDQVLLVIAGHDRRGRRVIGDIRIER